MDSSQVSLLFDTLLSISPRCLLIEGHPHSSLQFAASVDGFYKVKMGWVLVFGRMSIFHHLDPFATILAPELTILAKLFYYIIGVHRKKAEKKSISSLPHDSMLWEFAFYVEFFFRVFLFLFLFLTINFNDYSLGWHGNGTGRDGFVGLCFKGVFALHMHPHRGYLRS